jgi:hypothetical protein
MIGLHKRVLPGTAVNVYAVEGLPAALPLGWPPPSAAPPNAGPRPMPLALPDPYNASAASESLTAARRAAAGGSSSGAPAGLEAALVPAAGAAGAQLAAVRALRALAPPMFIICW